MSNKLFEISMGFALFIFFGIWITAAYEFHKRSVEKFNYDTKQAHHYDQCIAKNQAKYKADLQGCYDKTYKLSGETPKSALKICKDLAFNLSKECDL